MRAGGELRSVDAKSCIRYKSGVQREIGKLARKRADQAVGEVGSRPLYVQVRDQLKGRISSGAWRPGQLIPNEFVLADEMGVSQGTARKALDSLASEGLLVRRQGRGTFVVEHTPSDVLFRFFNLFGRDDEQIAPDSANVRVSVAKASTAERGKLKLASGGRVIRINRNRTRGGRAFVVETLVLPADRFPGLEAEAPLPNTLYDFFQKRYGVTVARGDERVSAVLARAREAKALGVDAGAPLLRLDRLMFDLEDRVVEWRVSLCHLEDGYYGVRLG